MRYSRIDASHSRCNSNLEICSRIMNLDPRAVELAKQTLDALLSAETDKQCAYLFRFPDGRVSLELEWIDIHSRVRAVIATYVDHGTPAA